MAIRITLPTLISMEILYETQAHFQYQDLQELNRHKEEQPVQDYQAQLKKEKFEQLQRLRAEFSDASDEIINQQFKDKNGEYYNYWNKLPQIIADEKKNVLYSQLDNVKDLGWIVNYRKICRGGQYLAGAMALYYFRHERIIEAIHGVSAAILYILSKDLSVIEKSCESFKTIQELTGKDEATPSQMIEKIGEVFEEIKGSGYFLRYVIHGDEEVKTEERLKKFSDISKGIHLKIKEGEKWNEEALRGVFQDVGRLVGKIKWGTHFWTLGGAFLAIYAYRRRAYLTAFVGALHIVAAGKMASKLRAFHIFSLNIANAEEGKAFEVYQEKVQIKVM